MPLSEQVRFSFCTMEGLITISESFITNDIKITCLNCFGRSLHPPFCTGVTWAIVCISNTVYCSHLGCLNNIINFASTIFVFLRKISGSPSGLIAEFFFVLVYCCNNVLFNYFNTHDIFSSYWWNIVNFFFVFVLNTCLYWSINTLHIFTLSSTSKGPIWAFLIAALFRHKYLKLFFHVIKIFLFIHSCSHLCDPIISLSAFHTFTASSSVLVANFFFSFYIHPMLFIFGIFHFPSYFLLIGIKPLFIYFFKHCLFPL